MFIRSFILSLQLFFDKRVPILNKLIPLGAVAYFLSPLDFLPDLLPYGMLDDFAILLFLLNLFVQVAPEHVLREHTAQMAKHDRLIRIISNIYTAPVANQQQQQQVKQQRQDPNVIDGEVVK